MVRQKTRWLLVQVDFFPSPSSSADVRRSASSGAARKSCSTSSPFVGVEAAAEAAEEAAEAEERQREAAAKALMSGGNKALAGAVRDNLVETMGLSASGTDVNGTFLCMQDCLLPVLYETTNESLE